jgi:hypothetical protein
MTRAETSGGDAMPTYEVTLSRRTEYAQIILIAVSAEAAEDRASRLGYQTLEALEWKDAGDPQGPGRISVDEVKELLP